MVRRRVGGARSETRPVVRARDLLLVVLVDAVVEREVRLQVRVLRQALAQRLDDRDELGVLAREILGGIGAQIGVDQRRERLRVEGRDACGDGVAASTKGAELRAPRIARRELRAARRAPSQCSKSP